MRNFPIPRLARYIVTKVFCCTLTTATLWPSLGQRDPPYCILQRKVFTIGYGRISFLYVLLTAKNHEKLLCKIKTRILFTIKNEKTIIKTKHLVKKKKKSICKMYNRTYYEGSLCIKLNRRAVNRCNARNAFVTILRAK